VPRPSGPTLAAKFARVCDRTVPKALRSFHAVAPNPDRELAEARECIDRSDERGAIKRLNRARRGYLKRHDLAGLEHLLVLADLVEARDERSRIDRDNLLYALKQNLRQESRRHARLREEHWHDPYPDLHASTEHTRIAFTRGVKVAIATAVALATVAIVGAIVVSAVYTTSETMVTLRIVNDTHSQAMVRGCSDDDCAATWTRADLDPGLSTEREVPAKRLVELFQVERPGLGDLCLPLRLHDAYRHAGSKAGVFVAKLSDATPCPGTTVLPRAAPQRGL
jgi:hypothetical protein